MGGLELLIQKLFDFIELFKFWRVIPINKLGVRTRLGKNPVLLQAGLHFILPFEIDHLQTCIVRSEWVSTHVVHITTTDLKTITVGPAIKYTITDPIQWLYGVNDAPTNLHDVTRLSTSEILTDCNWEECLKKSVSTKIKNRIKDKSEGLGIRIEDFGLADLTISRIIITAV